MTLYNACVQVYVSNLKNNIFFCFLILCQKCKSSSSSSICVKRCQYIYSSHRTWSRDNILKETSGTKKRFDRKPNNISKFYEAKTYFQVLFFDQYTVILFIRTQCNIRYVFYMMTTGYYGGRNIYCYIYI